MNVWIGAMAARTWAIVRELAAALRVNGEVTERQVRRVFG
jgi:hypothetical protein